MIAANDTASLRPRRSLRQWASDMACAASDFFADRHLRIRTTGSSHVAGVGRVADCIDYQAPSYSLLSRCVDAMELKENDVVFDISAALGRATCVLARRSVRKCIGIEADQRLAAHARQNLERVRGKKSPAEVVMGDPAIADYSQGSVFCLFGAIDAPTLAAVLNRIRQSIGQIPRPIRLMYANPVHRDTVVAAGWLRPTRVVTARWSDARAIYWESSHATSRPKKATPADDIKIPTGADLMDAAEVQADRETLVVWSRDN